jgi:UDP-N-acetylglucosamine 2-epimerase (non-hydrolysing)
MPRLLFIFGTRPEAIKLAPVINAARKQPSLETVICVTAQHRQMLDQILDWFDITPDVDLNLMLPDQTLAGLAARAIEAITTVIAQVKPDMVIVQGDTTTAMTGALSAFYHKIPVGHVEAGLRTYDRDNPYPEEINRHLISVLAACHFAPTEAARQALLAERTPATSIYVTGNTVIDALQWTVAQPYQLDANIPLGRASEKLILITGHRRESFGPGFESICQALRQIAERNPETRLVYPVHLNPHVQEPVRRILGSLDRIHLIDPLPYPAFAHLMAKCNLILTDSGGVQEEAPSLGKPVLVMRRTTERPEAVEAGTAKLVGTDTGVIVRETEKLLHDPAAYAAMANAISPFGDGHAAERIAGILAQLVAGKAAG